MASPLSPAALAAALFLSAAAPLAAGGLLAQMDFDGDGTTTLDEATVAQNLLFDPADANGDGVLSKDEYKGLLAEVTQRHSTLGRNAATAVPAPGRVDAFTYADSDADGVVSRLEYHRISRLTAASLDRDRNGVISEQDFAGAAAGN